MALLELQEILLVEENETQPGHRCSRRCHENQTVLRIGLCATSAGPALLYTYRQMDAPKCAWPHVSVAWVLLLEFALTNTFIVMSARLLIRKTTAGVNSLAASQSCTQPRSRARGGLSTT